MSMNFATDVVINDGQQIKMNKISAPTSSGGSTYGNGTSGQVIQSDGTNVYWNSLGTMSGKTAGALTWGDLKAAST